MMRRGIYNLLVWVVTLLGLLLGVAGVLFLVSNLLIAVFPTLPHTTYPQAFVLTLLGALILVAWRLVFGRVP